MSFDIVIPVGPNDIGFVTEHLSITKKNIIGYRNIYIITSAVTMQCGSNDIIIIDENIFPFCKETVKNILPTHMEWRVGWYLQQLLKLYAPFIINGILDNILVIDADTVFLRPTTFIDTDNRLLYNYGDENFRVYFEHIDKLSIGVSKLYPDKSGICHHMMFNREIIAEIITKIETKFNDKFYNVFLQLVDFKTTDVVAAQSGASEYELYFNYIFKYKPDAVRLRKLKWANVSSFNPAFKDTYDYVSCHHYMRS